MSIRPVTIRTNAFPLTSYPNCDVFQHEINFNPPLKSAADRRAYIRRLQLRVHPDIFGKTCPYDGDKQLFSFKLIQAKTYRVPKYDKDCDLDKLADPKLKCREVSIQLVARVPAQAIQQILKTGKSSHGEGEVQHVISYLNVTVKHDPFLRGIVQTGQSFFPGRRELIKDLTPALQLWKGLYLSVRLTKTMPVLNIDVASAIMVHPTNLVDLMLSLTGVRNMSELCKDHVRAKSHHFMLKKVLRHLRVKTTYSDREYTVDRLIMEGARHYTFEDDKSDSQPTVEEYFAAHHRIRLNYPKVFSVKVNKTAVVPAELLEVIPGQLFKGRLDAHAVSRVLSFTKVKPDQRLGEIQSGLRDLNFQSSPAMIDSGIRVSENPLDVKGGLVQPPSLTFGKNMTVPISGGKWDFMHKSVCESGYFAFCVVLLFEGTPEGLARPIQLMHATCSDIGIKMEGRPYVKKCNGQAHIEEQMKEAVRAAADTATNKNGRPLVVAVIPDVAKDLRDWIKHAGDIKLGVPTQCFKISKFSRGDDQYFRLAAVKINSRGGGIPSFAVVNPTLSDKFFGKPIMIMGADVSHASPGSRFPSIAGVVSSTDFRCVRYTGRSSPQPFRMERIENLAEMTAASLKSFFKYWLNTRGKHCLPARIIFYRDGISEGELEAVAHQEIKQIKEGIVQHWKTGPGLENSEYPLPTLIYITAIKRHHIRLIPRSQAEADRTGNVHPGTVTGPEFAAPNSEDFYLVSHKGLLGTSRPTHYNIILNEDKGITTADLISFTNAMCYNFSRATVSVSQITPVYYAHLLSGRAAVHLGPRFQGIEMDMMTTASGESLSPEEVAAKLYARVKEEWLPIHNHMKEEMYFL